MPVVFRYASARFAVERGFAIGFPIGNDGFGGEYRRGVLALRRFEHGFARLFERVSHVCIVEVYRHKLKKQSLEHFAIKPRARGDSNHQQPAP